MAQTLTEQLVAVRFQAWFEGESTRGYADISDDRTYAPFRLNQGLASNSVLSDWSEHYVTWKTMIPKSMALKALSKETTWRLTHLECPDQDVLVCKGPKAPDDNSEIAVVALDMNDGYCGIEVSPFSLLSSNTSEQSVRRETSLSSEERDTSTREIANDFLDYHIVQISLIPLEGRDVACFDSKGRFLSMCLQECIDGGISTGPESIVTRYSKLKGEVVYYVRLNDWSGSVNTGDPEDNGDQGDFAEGTWTLSLLAMIGDRVLDRVAQR